MTATTLEDGDFLKTCFLQVVGLIAGLTPRKTTNVAVAIATTQLHTRKPRGNGPLLLLSTDEGSASHEH